MDLQKRLEEAKININNFGGKIMMINYLIRKIGKHLEAKFDWK
jgi:hypothetical protein